MSKLDNVTIDYAGFHGPVASAMVRDRETPFSWLESVLLIGYYCDDEDHEGDCNCVDEDQMKQAFLDNITARNMWIVED